MIRIVYSRRAEQELRAIWCYLAIDNDNEAAADRVLLAISNKIELLRDHPRLGPRRSDIAKGARLLIEGHFLVLYQTHPDLDDKPVDVVEIVSIVDGRRDLNGAVLSPQSDGAKAHQTILPVSAYFLFSSGNAATMLASSGRFGYMVL